MEKKDQLIAIMNLGNNFVFMGLLLLGTLFASACNVITATPREAVLDEITPSPVYRPGGPDDETIPISILNWPSALEEIPENLSGDGGLFSIVDVEAPNVRERFDTLKARIESSSHPETGKPFIVVGSPDEMISSEHVFLSPTENTDQQRWTIGGITNEGFVMPVSNKGLIMDRPDIITSDVSHFALLNDGLGENEMRRYEYINEKWVPVTRDNDGNRRAFYILNGDFIYDPSAETDIIREWVFVGTESFFPGGTRTELPESITAYMPIDESKMFKINGETVQYGYTWNLIGEGFHVDLGKVENQITYIVARFRGIVPGRSAIPGSNLKDDIQLAIFEIPFDIGESLYFYFPLFERSKDAPVRLLYEEDLAKTLENARTNLDVGKDLDIPENELIELLKQPEFIGIPVAIPFEFSIPGATGDLPKQSDKAIERFLEVIENKDLPEADEFEDLPTRSNRGWVFPPQLEEYLGKYR